MAKIIIYEHARYAGRCLELTENTPNLVKLGFNDIVSSVKVLSGAWTLFEHVDYKGKPLTLTPGSYDIDAINKLGNDKVSSLKSIPFIIVYEHARYSGRCLEITENTPNFVKLGFNDIVSSAKVKSGTWTLFEHVDYKGRYATIGEGDFSFEDVKRQIGNDIVSSVKCISPRPSISLFEHHREEGRKVELHADVPSLAKINFDNKVSSVHVEKGTWVLYDGEDYKGACVELGPGRYPLDHIVKTIGNDKVSSVKLKL